MNVASWRECRLGDLLEIKHGFAFLGEHFAVEGTHIVLTPGNFFDEGGFKHKGDKEKWYRGPIPSDYVLKKDDLIIAMTEQAEGLLGSSAIIPQSGLYLHNQRLGLVQVRDSQQVDKHFIYYLFNSKPVRQQIRGSASGTKIRHTAPSRIADVKVNVPAAPIQRRIAGILSAYDELIENSQRRIKILESMARALYREWFVHFRFPGHESVPKVPSPLGEIPKGWEVKKLGDFVEFKSGFAFKSGTFSADGEYRLVTIKNVQDGSFHPESDSRIDELPQKMPPYCVLVDGDILLSLTGNVGRVCLVYDGPFLLNQRVSKLVPLDASDWAMTYCMFREPEMRIKLEMLSNGVAQQNLSPVLASQMEAALPPRQLRQNFKVAAEPMVRSVVQLFSKIQNLRRTRDLLLPRLLSGQIDVEAMPS